MPRAKVKPEPVLKSWAQVDEALKEIGEVSDRIAGVTAEMEEALAGVREEFQAEILPLNQRKGRLEKDVKEFSETKIAELEQEEDRRSKVLNWGTVYFKRDTRLTTAKNWTWKAVIEALRTPKARRFLRIKREPNKEAIKAAVVGGSLGAEQLAEFGMRVQERDHFRYNLGRREIRQRDGA